MLDLFNETHMQDQFLAHDIYVSALKLVIKLIQLFSSSNYNISILLRSSDFVHQFSECDLIFATSDTQICFFSKKICFDEVW